MLLIRLHHHPGCHELSGTSQPKIRQQVPIEIGSANWIVEVAVVTIVAPPASISAPGGRGNTVSRAVIVVLVVGCEFRAVYVGVG